MAERTELKSKRSLTEDIEDRLEQRKRQSQTMHSNMRSLSKPSRGASMVKENPMIGGY